MTVSSVLRYVDSQTASMRMHREMSRYFDHHSYDLISAGDGSFRSVKQKVESERRITVRQKLREETGGILFVVTTDLLDAPTP